MTDADSNANTEATRERHSMSDAVNEIDNSDPARLREGVARAVDFRGDVTIVTTDGRAIAGYAFDARLGATPDPAKDEIRVLPADSNERVRVPLGTIRTLAFTGKDAASGKSWESWIRRYAEKKLAGEAASIESEAL